MAMQYNVSLITEADAWAEPQANRLFPAPVVIAARCARLKANGKPRWIRAIDEAELLYERISFEDMPNGTVRVTDPNTGLRHTVAQHGKCCDCETSRSYGVPCFHRAAVWLRSILAKRGEQ